MSASSDCAQRALAAGSRVEVLASLLPDRPVLTLPEIQRLTQHLEAMGNTGPPVRLGILHTYTSDLLNLYLRFEALLQGLQPAIYHGPYAAVLQETASSSGLVAHNPDVTLLLLQWEDLDPDLATPLAGVASAERESLTTRVRAHLLQLVGALRRVVKGHLLVSLLPSPSGPGLGDFDATAPNSEQFYRAHLKAEIAMGLRTQLASTTLLDLDESIATIGRDRFFDLRWWYTSRFPFSPGAAQDLARRVIAVGAVLKHPRAKVIVLDADNTLWGGIVGEDGLDGIALGPDYPGNAYVAFQRRLLEYQQRGFVLALCSKNNEADVLEVLRRHPHQVLREEHFAALLVNWEPKPRNLEALSDQLNLGLDSFLFVDDSAHECAAVRQALPAVEVIQAPSRPIALPSCLDRIARLQVIALTDEDRRKTEMYVQERRRGELAATSGDIASYLRSLQMEMSVSLSDARQVVRIAQLTQKTNQFNLTSRRYTEDAVARLIDADDWLVATFSLRDIFGDSGLVGVALIHLPSPQHADLDTFLMSCRVIGREAESAFLGTILRLLRKRGIQVMTAHHLPTAKNQLVEGFLPNHGFIQIESGEYQRDLEMNPPPTEDAHPIRITLAELKDPAIAAARPA